MEDLKKFINIPLQPMLSPLPKKWMPHRVRSMSDESDWVPLPDDPLTKQLEKIKISETK
jgi:hypothetical protein